jgi:catechol 2,3-dioxygenase-like lactoylglutathione lyase family enzyme
MDSKFKLSQITAVMLGVRDLPKALAFYEGQLGLPLIMKETEIALLQCGTVMLGLSRGLASNAPALAGATEVVFQVGNIRAAHLDMKTRGIVFVDEPRQVTPAHWAVHFRDVDGHLLSIFGPEGHL